MKRVLLAASCASLLAYGPALAADDDASPSASPPSAEDCRVAFDQGDAAKDLREDDGDRTTLADKLDRCNGVLTPPKTGDTEMTAPAPDSGTTPVIPPGQVPEQAPKE